MRLLRRGRLTALAAVAVGLLAGGVAYAAIPGSGGVISGCYKKIGGALRVIDAGAGVRCNASETPLNWNQTGPRGATGDQGPSGPAGPIGPSNAYTNYGTPQNLPVNGAADLVSVVLPAGRYTLSGTVTSESTNANPIFTQCQFESTAVIGQPGASASGLVAQIALIGDVDVTSDGTTVSLHCALPFSGPATMLGGMIATRAGAVSPAS